MVDICVLMLSTASSSGLWHRRIFVHAMLRQFSFSSREVANDGEGRKTVRYQSLLSLSSSTLIAIDTFGALVMTQLPSSASLMIESQPSRGRSTVLQVFDAAAEYDNSTSHVVTIINVQKLTSSNLLLRTTPTEAQILVFQAAESCQMGFDVLRRLYLYMSVC
jgi:hypothetical protein